VQQEYSRGLGIAEQSSGAFEIVNTKLSARSGSPKLGTWIVCLVLFAVPVGARIGVIQPGPAVATWSWILGFGLLLVACRYRGV
jgi:hypothetical protein